VTSLGLLRLYAETAITLTIALALARLAWSSLRRFETRPRLWSTLSYGLLIAAAGAPLAERVLSPRAAAFAPRVQVWSGTTADHARLSVRIGGAAGRARGSSDVWRGSLSPGIVEGLAAIVATVCAFGIARLARLYARLRRHCEALPVLRRQGRVRVCLSDRDGVPFSAWTGTHAYVVLPVDVFGERAHRRLALAHEIEHLRRRDTAWVYVVAALRALFPWHPAVSGWSTFLARLQDVACDQALIARGAAPAEYGECLLRAVAGVDRGPASVPIGACLVASGDRFLRRRIEMLIDTRRRQSKWLVPAIGAASLALVGLGASAARDTVADRRVSLTEAQQIARELARDTGFQVPLDETVLAQLNEMVGAPERRAYWTAALDRASEARPQIAVILTRHQVPPALAAVALFESGFRNLPADPTGKVRGVGLWQFIPETAAHFGLRVDKEVDQRLDPLLATAAAARYLDHLHAELGDWPLSIAAYNHGEQAVRVAIARRGTRSAAELVRQGELSSYSSGVLAAMLLSQRPALLR
jgi:membrane-bound lytic murein transglycosylase D